MHQLTIFKKASLYQRKKIDNDKDQKEAHIDLLLGKHICSFKMHQLVSFDDPKLCYKYRYDYKLREDPPHPPPPPKKN